MEQSVMVFATTGARDSAITAPEAGMTAYINSGDSSEGLYSYTGTTWNKGPSWNAPWGYIGHAASTASVTTSGTTETTLLNTGAFTWVTNRYYLITASTDGTGNVNNDQFIIRLRNNSISGTVLASNITSFEIYSYYSPLSFTFVHSQSGAATAGLYLTAQRSNGSSTFSGGGSNTTTFITVTDIGPSGAPN
jgi:hypothetical protein